MDDDDAADAISECIEVRKALRLGQDATLADVLAEIGWLQAGAVDVPPRPSEADFDSLPRVPPGLLS